MDTPQIVWKVLRLTEKALSLLEGQRLDEAIAMVDNREKLLNILLTKNDISEADHITLKEIDKLNVALLSKFEEMREQLKQNIQKTHHNAQAHKAYHSTQLK